MAINTDLFSQVHLAAESAYSEASTSFADTDIIEVDDISFDLGGTRHERNPKRGGPHELSPVQGSYHGGTINLKGIVAGKSSVAPTADVAVHPLSNLFYSVLGGRVISGFAAAAAAGSGTAGNVKADGSVAATTWKAGSALAVANASAGLMVGWIKSVTDNAPSDHDLELILPMAAAPASGGALYGSEVNFLALPGSNPGVSMRVKWQPENAENRMILHGARVQKLELSITPDQQIAYDAQLVGDRWTLDSGSDLTNFAFQYPKLPVAIGRYTARHVYGDGGGGVNELDTQSLKVTMEAKYTPSRSVNASNGVRNLNCTHRMVRLSATREILDTFVAQNLLVDLGDAMQFDLGTAAGNTISMLVPNPITVDRDSPSAEEDRWVQSFTWGCGRYVDDGTTNAAGSAFRWAWL